MPTIKRDALHAFIDRQLFLVESTPVPGDVPHVVDGRPIDDDEVHALWIGAGIATQIGLELLHAPHRFVEPWPVVPAEAAG
jgi:hypothetical protein